MKGINSRDGNYVIRAPDVCMNPASDTVRDLRPVRAESQHSLCEEIAHRGLSMESFLSLMLSPFSDRGFVDVTET